MSRALELADEGRYLTAPNPQVGCVVVRPPSDSTPEYQIVGEGAHRVFGGPHAERDALTRCQDSAAGCTLYVTLEPCSHQGKTPPCTEAIIEAGIARVVAATLDPFPANQGKGIAQLRAAGIQFEVGLFEEEARFQNRFFFHRHETGMPWVILKAAVSLDGKCATASRQSQWITSELAREDVHRGRAEVDAVLCGIGTVMHDNPQLTARPKDLPEATFRQPTRIVLDPLLEIPPASALLRHLAESPTWLFCSEQASTAILEKLQVDGVRVTPVAGDGQRLDLREVLRHIAEAGCLSVWLEGGPFLHTAFLEAELVNEVRIYVAPKLIGGGEAPTFYMGEGKATMSEINELDRLNRQFLGNDTLISGILRWRLD